MRQMRWALAALTVASLAGCASEHGRTWFDGDLEAARIAAAERRTLIMVEFYTDWCSWCRRLEADTFKDPAVREELGQLVALRADAEGDGRELAAKLAVDSYPTIVFLDSRGGEVDRILGYLPPDRFVEQVRRIRAGDNLLASLRRLEENPGDFEALQRAVPRLLEQSDPAGAMDHIDAYRHAAAQTPVPASMVLVFEAGSKLLEREYRRAATLYKRGALASGELDADTGVTPQLAGLLEGGPLGLAGPDLALELRSARQRDAEDLLDSLPVALADARLLREAAEFAVGSGLHDRAVELYGLWFEREGAEANGQILNLAAWNLYISGSGHDLALEMARSAYERWRQPTVADTIARLLYARGEVDEAIEMQRWAAEHETGEFRDEFHRVLETMEARRPLDDPSPIERFPG